MTTQHKSRRDRIMAAIGLILWGAVLGGTMGPLVAMAFNPDDYQARPTNAADYQINKRTGALLTEDVRGSEANATSTYARQIAQWEANLATQVGALQANLARVVPDSNALRAATDVVCAGSWRIAIQADSNSILNLCGGDANAMPARMVGFLLVRESGSYDQLHYRRLDANANNSAQWPGAGYFRRTTMAEANDLRWISNGSTVYATYEPYVPR